MRDGAGVYRVVNAPRLRSQSFALTARFAQGEVLEPRVVAPTMATAKHGDVAALDAVATYDPENGRVAVFVVNRHPSESVAFSTDLRYFGGVELVEATTLGGEDLFAVNSVEHPDRVVPKGCDSAKVVDGALEAELPPASWSMFVLQTS